MSAPTLYRDARGRLRLRGDWPARIDIAGSLLALAAEGGTVGMAVTGRGVPPSFEIVVFAVADGPTTYDLLPQDGDDLARDVWRGVRRDC
jgi:hypothetical protein